MLSICCLCRTMRDHCVSILMLRFSSGLSMLVFGISIPKSLVVVLAFCCIWKTGMCLTWGTPEAYQVSIPILVVFSSYAYQICCHRSALWGCYQACKHLLHSPAPCYFLICILGPSKVASMTAAVAAGIDPGISINRHETIVKVACLGEVMNSKHFCISSQEPLHICWSGVFDNRGLVWEMFWKSKCSIWYQHNFSTVTVFCSITIPLQSIGVNLWEGLLSCIATGHFSEIRGCWA